MDIRKAKIQDKMYDVCSLEDYVSNSSAYTPSMTAIEIKDLDMILPVRSKLDPSPGIVVGKTISMVQFPDNKEEYSSDNIIDFNNLSGIREAMEKQQMVKDMESEILTDPDNIYTPTIDDADSPVMVGLKSAIIKKNIDFDKYAPRFGSNYNNDKRLLNKHTISLSKLETMIDALDIKGTLILEDKSPDVPNPIGEKIIIDLKGTDEDD